MDQFQKKIAGLRPVSDAVEDLDYLLQDPKEALSRKPLVFSHRPPLWIYLALPPLVALLAAIISGSLVAAAIGFASAVILLAMSLLIPRTRLELGVQGVKLERGSRRVELPWDLFAAPGRPTQDALGTLRIPVNPAHVHQAKAFKRHHLTAEGRAVKLSLLFSFRSDDEAGLSAQVGVDPEELGALLLSIGNSMAAASGSVPSEGVVPMARVGSLPQDWITVRLTQLEFPPECCECNASTGSSTSFYGGSHWWLLQRIVGLEFYVDVPVPRCDSCRKKARKAGIKGMLIGLLLGVLVVLLGAVAAAYIPKLETAGVILAGVLFVVLPIVGYFIGRGRNPVKLRSYRMREGTVQMKFVANPAYAARVKGIVQA